jgi:ketosteroid isomerase-like protein
MSANVDVVRSVYAAWERGDWSSNEWAHAEIELVRADGPSPDSWSGLTELAEGTREFLSAWKEARMEAEEYRELDSERVLVLDRYVGRGKASGADVGQMGSKTATIFHLGGGKVTRLVLYWSRERALADLGLGV